MPATATSSITISSRSHFEETFISPTVACHQGYTTDGTNHFTIDTQCIYKRADDAQWSVILSNSAPLAGLPNVQHLGDGDYYNGKLYIVGENWAGNCVFSYQNLLVFDATTLARLEVHDVSAQGHEVSGCCVVPEQGSNGVIYVTSYCDGSRLFKYDLATFQFLGTLPLSQSIPYIQGVTSHNGMLYISSDNGYLCSCDPNGNVAVIYATAVPGNHEGLDFSQNEIRWLIDAGGTNRCVHYISPAGLSLSWQGTGTNVVLEQATTLATNAWTAVTNKCVTNQLSGMCSTLPTAISDAQCRFFRLRSVQP